MDEAKDEIEQVESVDLVEDHLYSFNQTYYKPALYSSVINLTTDEISDYTDIYDWSMETGIPVKCYSESLKLTTNSLVIEEDKEKIIKGFDRNILIERYQGFDETRIIEYTRLKNGKPTKMRSIIHIFKTAQSDDLYAYLKVFVID